MCLHGAEGLRRWLSAKHLPRHYETLNFVNRHFILSWQNLIQFTASDPIFLSSTLILLSHVRILLPSSLFHSVFFRQKCWWVWLPMNRPPHSRSCGSFMKSTNYEAFRLSFLHPSVSSCLIGTDIQFVNNDERRLKCSVHFCLLHHILSWINNRGVY
jgi:hypothetical protein